MSEAITPGFFIYFYYCYLFIDWHEARNATSFASESWRPPKRHALDCQAPMQCKLWDNRVQPIADCLFSLFLHTSSHCLFPPLCLCVWRPLWSCWPSPCVFTFGLWSQLGDQWGTEYKLNSNHSQSPFCSTLAGYTGFPSSPGGRERGKGAAAVESPSQFRQHSVARRLKHVRVFFFFAAVQGTFDILLKIRTTSCPQQKGGLEGKSLSFLSDEPRPRENSAEKNKSPNVWVVSFLLFQLRWSFH